MRYWAWRSRLSDVIWGLEKALLSDAIRGLEKPCCLMRKNKFMRDHLYRKNEIVTVAIEDMTGDGEGIGHVDGYTLFVKDAVIGDEIRARIGLFGCTRSGEMPEGQELRRLPPSGT